MSKTTQPAKAPTATEGGKSTKSAPSSGNAKRDFYLAAANMSWQLAIVVLVPVVGGFKLDEHLHSLPLWTFVGFSLAMIGMAIIVWRQLQLLSPGTSISTKGSK